MVVSLWQYVLAYLIMVIITLGALSIFYRFIYVPHKQAASIVPFSDMLVILNAAINTEFELYDKDVFSTKGSITNANFENFYADITRSIVDSLAPTFYIKMSYYITEDAVISIIARQVKNFLSDKVHGVL